MPRSTRRPSALAAITLAVAVLTACTPTPGPSPTASASPTVSAPPTEAAPAPTGPQLIADGDAAENLPYFTSIVSEVWGGPDRVSGRAYVDALVAGGFDRAAMQVTADESTVGNPAESIFFAVRWGEDCLIGQVGPATGQPVTTVLPALGDGGCLVGQTRPIDW